MITRLHRWSAHFDPRPGTTDAEVLDEVWRSNDYRIGPAGFHGAVVVDVGANVGAFTVLAAQAGAFVHAYEPCPANRARLEHHVGLNGVADRVTIHPEAVAAKTGGMVWITGDGGAAHIADTGETAVETVALTDILTGLGQVAMLKHDAEGAEWDIFEPVTAHLLHEHVARIALEWHGPRMWGDTGRIREDGYLERWHHVVDILADSGRLEIRGHPTVGGLIHWARY